MREEIHQIVSAITPFDNLENEQIHFVLNWINSGIELCRTQKPATPDIHLVSYFIIVSSEMDQILLVDHKRAGLWLHPGGHVEPGEHPKEAAKREAQEELKITAEFLFEGPLFLTVTPLKEKDGAHTDVSLWYVLKGDPAVALDYDTNEFHQIRWFEMDEIPSNSDPHTKRFLQKLRYLTQLDSS